MKDILEVGLVHGWMYVTGDMENKQTVVSLLRIVTIHVRTKSG